MSKPLFRVIKPGLLTTIQDLGRYGFQQYGIVASGVMDPFSMQIANLLVGNRKEEAVLEITMTGPTLEALDDILVAICGGNLSPTVDGQEIKMWKSFLMTKGQLLSFSSPQNGARAYLSVGGGFDIPYVLGSKSTYLKGKIGGYKGRALQKEDILYGEGFVNRKLAGRKLKDEEIPKYSNKVNIRVILGPHIDYFTKEGVNVFLSSVYTVTQQSDRMGYRLTGPKIEHKDTADIISDAIPFGGIQVPANGEPIILMADRQTTGGYTRIGTVVSVDIPLLGQILPGHQVSFSSITVENAQEEYRKRAILFKIMANS